MTSSLQNVMPHLLGILQYLGYGYISWTGIFWEADNKMTVIDISHELLINKLQSGNWSSCPDNCTKSNLLVMHKLIYYDSWFYAVVKTFWGKGKRIKRH